MAAAKYLGTSFVGQEPDIPSVADVEIVDPTLDSPAVLNIAYWPSLIAQWGKAGTLLWVEVEALLAAGFPSDAQVAVQKGAPSWGAQWILNNITGQAPPPDPTPTVDPLL